ncbi:MAG TPA: hypothetical protein VGN46_03175 [Luteibacter sp.]|jgi:chromosome segregation ATPase|uniref:hypothetical protein n=1 Tax=Luteibacter sp. TaxID=1886636 RepID=UPI002F3FECBA
MSTEETSHPCLDLAAQPSRTYVSQTQAQISIEMLTDITSKLSCVDQKVDRCAEDLKSLEGRFHESMKSIEGKFDAVLQISARMEASANGMESRLEASIKDGKSQLEESIKDLKSHLEGSIKGVETRLAGSINGVESRLEGSIVRVESRLDDSFKYLNTKIDTLSREVAPFLNPFEELRRDIKDLVGWKHRVWGMLILAGAIVTLGTGAWAFVGDHLEWKSEVGTTSAAVSVR